MEIKQFVLYNGDYIDEENALFPFDNRAFMYGDALFETIHANGTVLQFTDDHLERLTHGLKTLKMQVPAPISSGSISQMITRLLHKNRYLKGARVRLTVFRDSQGKYVPESNNTSYYVTSEKLDKYKYELNDTGLKIDIFSDLKKSTNYLSNIKTTNTLLYTMAGLYAKENGYNDSIIVNEHGHLLEATSSNIFLIKNNKLYTPPISDGCVPGIMRKQILKLAKKNKYEISSNTPIAAQTLDHADEVFLTNAISGIRWVAGYNKKRYFNTHSKKLIRELNDFAFGVNS